MGAGKINDKKKNFKFQDLGFFFLFAYFLNFIVFFLILFTRIAECSVIVYFLLLIL